MLYPVYVHPGDKRHAHGVTIPDFPGCFSAADEWEELPEMVQEAVEAWIEGEDLDIPKPTPLQDLAHDPNYQDGGVWMLINVDVERLRPKRARRINITLSEDVLAKLDAAAKHEKETRSAYIAKLALQAAVRHSTLPATAPGRKKKPATRTGSRLK